MHPDNMFMLLNNAIQGNIEDNFKKYISRHKCSKWTVASDFVIDAEDRFNNTYILTIFPHNKDIQERLKKIKEILPADLKQTQTITATMLDYLSSQDLFHFCFIINQNVNLIPDKETAQKMIDETIKMVQGWPQSQIKETVLKKIKLFRHKSQRNTFSCARFQSAVLTATFTAFIFYLILSKNEHAELFCWAPDRDNMISELDGGLIYDMVNITFNSFCQRTSLNNKKIQFLYTSPAAQGPNWFDELIRLSDFLAGPLSAFDFTNNKIRDNPVSRKYTSIIHGVIADNPNTAIILLHEQNPNIGPILSGLTISNETPEPVQI